MTRLAPLNGLRTSNLAERQVIDHLHRQGWFTLKNGWPDFLSVDEEGNLRFIEVKPRCTNGLSARQENVADLLACLGIRVELYATECVCGRHDDAQPFRVGLHPNLPKRRIRRSQRERAA